MLTATTTPSGSSTQTTTATGTATVVGNSIAATGAFSDGDNDALVSHW